MKLQFAPVRVTEQWTIKPKIVNRKKAKIRYWTETEIELSIRMYNAGKTAKEISKALPERSIYSIQQKLFAIRHDQEMYNHVS